MAKLWKEAERRIAGLLGGRRVPVTGRQRGDAPDIAHDNYSIEVKHRQELPAWLTEAFAQADAAREKDSENSKISLVILHEKGQKYEDSLALLRLKDFVELTKSSDYDTVER